MKIMIIVGIYLAISIWVTLRFARWLGDLDRHYDQDPQ